MINSITTINSKIAEIYPTPKTPAEPWFTFKSIAQTHDLNLDSPSPYGVCSQLLQRAKQSCNLCK